MNEIFVISIGTDGKLKYSCFDSFDGSSMPQDLKKACQDLIDKGCMIIIGSNIHVRNEDNRSL